MFLEQPEIIKLMTDASDEGFPAIQPLSDKLKEEFGKLAEQDDMKQLIGYIVRHVLSDNGYEHVKYRNKISEEEENIFVYGSTYKKRA